MRARSFDDRLAKRRVIYFDEMCAVGHLWIARGLRAGLHLVCRYATRLEMRLRGSGTHPGGPARYCGVYFASVVAPSLGGGQARIARQVAAIYHRTQSPPLGIGLARDRDPAIFARRRIHPVWRVLAIRVTDPPLDASVRRVIENRRGKEMQRGLRLRLVDVLTLSGAPMVIECGKNRHCGETWRYIIRIRAEWTGRRPIGPSGEVVKSGYRGGHVTETGDSRKRPALPHQAGTQHDDVGLEFAQRLVVIAPRAHRLGRERLGHHLCPLQEILHHFA